GPSVSSAPRKPIRAAGRRLQRFQSSDPMNSRRRSGGGRLRSGASDRIWGESRQSFPGAAEVFFDHAVQLARIDRLVQKIVHPRRQTLFPHPRLGGGGERDDGDVYAVTVGGFAHRSEEHTSEL